MLEAARAATYHLLSRCLATVLTVVDAVAFRMEDERIAELLLQQATADSAVALTHQQIAADFGTSREVFSRILADFAAGGLVQVRRGSVTIHPRCAD